MWSAVIDAHEALGARILQQLEKMNREAPGAVSLEKHRSCRTFREDRFITVDDVPARSEVIDACLAVSVNASPVPVGSPG